MRSTSKIIAQSVEQMAVSKCCKGMLIGYLILRNPVPAPLRIKIAIQLVLRGTLIMHAMISSVACSRSSRSESGTTPPIDHAGRQMY